MFDENRVVSEFNESIWQIQRLHNIWLRCEEHSKNGNFYKWNWALDCAYKELAWDIKELDKNEGSNYKKQLDQLKLKIYKSMRERKFGMLYEYLYAGGPSRHTRNIVFWFPHITTQIWRQAASSGRDRKDIRLYTQVADAILFSDGLVLKSDL